MRILSGDDLFIKSKTFFQTVKVKKDTAVHSEIQRDEMGFFNCPKCAYKTNKKPLLGGHIRRHTAVELGLFPCDVCQRVRKICVSSFNCNLIVFLF